MTIDSQGERQTYLFHDFSNASNSKGMLKSQTDTYGETITAESYNGPAIAELRCNRDGTIWSMLYSFYPAGAHTGRVQYATLRKSTDSGSSWNQIRRAQYDYYSGGETNGSANDLKRVTVQYRQGGNWLDAAKSYYRWYKQGQANGFAGAIKYMLGPQAYAEMLADNLTPETASDQQLATYANLYFEYDADQKVTKEIASGGGGGTGPAGETMTRTQSGHSDNYNHWKWKVVLSKANGNVETVYTNHLGQVMLRELKETAASSRKWIRYTKYGSTAGAEAKPLQQAGPDAVVSYNDAQADLGLTLQTAQGKITHNTYGDANTASGNP
ncbi:MAG: hypothetical protein MI861_09050, partial [Pirellulales bacterium]|nr:hypothetical protein [Pirellulales bacterium]